METSKQGNPSAVCRSLRYYMDCLRLKACIR